MCEALLGNAFRAVMACGVKAPFMLDSLTACGLKESRHPKRRMKSQLPLCYVKVHLAFISPSNMMN
jgi:hypothetical protein